MAKLALVRIDSRLIHGQVATQWIKRVEAKRVIIVDDAAAADEFMASIFQMAAPPGISVDVYSTQVAGEEWTKDQFGNKGPVLVLFRSVPQAFSAWNCGFQFPELQLGGIGGGPGRVNVAGPVALDKEDGGMLHELHKKGVHIYFQVTPNMNVTSWDTVKAKFFKEL